MNTLCCSDHLTSKGTRKGSGKSSRGHQSYGMASTELSAKEDLSFSFGKEAEEMMVN